MVGNKGRRGIWRLRAHGDHFGNGIRGWLVSHAPFLPILERFPLIPIRKVAAPSSTTPTAISVPLSSSLSLYIHHKSERENQRRFLRSCSRDPSLLTLCSHLSGDEEEEEVETATAPPRRPNGITRPLRPPSRLPVCAHRPGAPRVLPPQEDRRAGDHPRRRLRDPHPRPLLPRRRPALAPPPRRRCRRLVRLSSLLLPLQQQHCPQRRPPRRHRVVYCFSRTTPRGSGSCRGTASGTWLSNGGDKRVKVPGRGTVGYKSTLAFKIPGSGAKWIGTNWVMHEFKIHHERKAAKKSHGDGSSFSSEEEVLVLCRIRCTKQMGREEGSRVGRALQPDEVVSRQKRRRTSSPAELPGASVGGCVLWVSCCLQGEPLASGMLEQPAMSQEDLWGSVDWDPLELSRTTMGTGIL